MNDYGAPWNVTKVKKVVIKDGVKSISSCAFRDCTKLTSVTIANSVTYIGQEAFYGCSKLETVTIPNSVKTVGHTIFANCSNLKTVKLPNKLTNLSSSMFEGCKNLESITLPNSIRTIEHSAFRDCTGLKSIVIPDSVTTIGPSAFFDTGLEDVKVGKGVTSIGENAFCSTNLSKVTIPGNVKTIDDRAFSQCKKIKEVTIKSGVKSIGEEVFLDCTGIESVTIPNSVTKMGPSVFSHCYGLKSVQLGSGLTEISDGLFSCCVSLEKITIPKNIKRIGSASFAKCISLDYLNIPKTVETIDQFAFWACENLQLVKLNSKDIHIGSAPFIQCDNLVVQCPSDGNYLSELKKENVPYSTTNCQIPTEHVVDVTEAVKNGYGISLNWMYELKYDDIKNPKYIDRISQENKKIRKIYDDFYDILSGPTNQISDRLDGYSVKLDLEKNEDAYFTYVLSALGYDHPELFWAGSGAKSWTNEEDGTYSHFTFRNSFDTWEELESERQKFDAKVNEIVSQTEGMSDYEKVCYFAQYFWDNVEYNHSIIEGTATHPLASLCANYAYGAIIGQKGELGPTCEGFAAGMKVLCDAANINCSILSGTSNGTPHAWNAIEINGIWYDWEPQAIAMSQPIYDQEQYEKDLINAETVGFYDAFTSNHCEKGSHTWSADYKVISKATCKDNEIRRRICSTCGDYKTEGEDGTALGHKAGTLKVTKKATALKSGTKTQKCTRCNKTLKTVKIKPVKISLKKTTFTYTGKALKKSSQLPAVVVKDGNGNVISSKYYTVSKPDYKKVKEVGRYAYKVTFKDTCKEYSGKKTIYLKVVPSAKVPLKKIVASSKSITVNWKPYKQKDTKDSKYLEVHGYRITVATDKAFTKNVKKIDIWDYGKGSKEIKNLKANTKYYVQIQTCKHVNGLEYFGAPSAYKTCTTKR